ncbi:MAG: hypothetical protein ABSG90_14860 [Dehalococcoidia bacterium]
MPRLRAVIPRSVLCIGSEDNEELIADATLMAGRILDNAESKGKAVSASSAAYYAIQHCKSGRRAVGHSSSDVHGSATQLNGKSRLESMEQVVASNEESGGEIYELHDVLASNQEDPGTKAARKMDWDSLMNGLSKRDQAIIYCLIEGKPLASLARRRHLNTTTILYHKRRLADAIARYMGPGIIAESIRRPGWRDSIDATRMKMACRDERRHL